MPSLRRLQTLFVFCAIALLGALAPPAASSPARECLDQARAAAREIKLAGDQSAALRSIALVLAQLDPQAARNLAGEMRRPSDAARSLAAAAAATADMNPAAAALDVTTAGRLLLRIPNEDHRRSEQRMLLMDAAGLGEASLLGGSDLTASEACLAVLLARARSDPAAALDLLTAWDMGRTAEDRVLATITTSLAAADPEQAIELASTIGSARLRDPALWLIAEQRPPGEAIGIAQRISDAVMKSSLLASTAVRMAPNDPDAAALTADQVPVACSSALAQVAVAVVSSNRGRALELARRLPPRPRAWALGRIAVELASVAPARCEELLAEIGNHAEVVRLAVGPMAATDPDRAAAIARSLPDSQERDAALAEVARVLANSDPGRAEQLAWEISSPRSRERAIEPLVLAAARSDFDAATSLIGLVSDPALAARLCADVALRAAPRHPEASARLLSALPPSAYRGDFALEAAVAVLSAGGLTEEALAIADADFESDVSLRWIVPALARSQAGSSINLAADIANPYLHTLALVDAARELTDGERRCPAAPERARQVRPIVEWEGH